MSYLGLMYLEMVPQAYVMTLTEVDLKNMDVPLVCWRHPYENCTEIHDAFIAIGFIFFFLGEGSRKIRPNMAFF